MKQFSLLVASLIVVAAISGLAAPSPGAANVPAFPGTLANARYVYVASYDGDQFNRNLLPEDREAIGAVQNAIQQWGKVTLVYRPSDLSMPLQGWKIHASACLDNADRILAGVWDYCIPRGIPFKFVRSLQLLLLRNGKYANRGASGKFVTIYPADEAQLELVLTELGALLEGEPA